MNGLMSVAAVAVFFGIAIGLAVVVAAATRTARQVLRRRWQATLAPCGVVDEPAVAEEQQAQHLGLVGTRRWALALAALAEPTCESAVTRGRVIAES